MRRFKIWTSNFKSFVVTMLIGLILLFAGYGVYQRVIRDSRDRQEQFYINKIIDLERENTILKGKGIKCCQKGMLKV